MEVGACDHVFVDMEQEVLSNRDGSEYCGEEVFSVGKGRVLQA